LGGAGANIDTEEPKMTTTTRQPLTLADVVAAYHANAKRDGRIKTRTCKKCGGSGRYDGWSVHGVCYSCMGTPGRIVTVTPMPGEIEAQNRFHERWIAAAEIVKARATATGDRKVRHCAPGGLDTMQQQDPLRLMRVLDRIEAGDVDTVIGELVEYYIGFHSKAAEEGPAQSSATPAVAPQVPAAPVAKLTGVEKDIARHREALDAWTGAYEQHVVKVGRPHPMCPACDVAEYHQRYNRYAIRTLEAGGRPAVRLFD
jgi:hypothetical protein